MSVGTYLRIWDEGAVINVQPHEEPIVYEAVQRFVTEDRDSVLSLDLTSGGSFRTLASNISSWLISTPENRQRAVELDKLAQDEADAMKHNAGLF